MQYLIIICFFCLNLIAQDNVYINSSVSSDKEKYLVGANDSFSKNALIVVNYPNKGRYTVQQYKNGRRDGISITFKSHGRIEEIKSFKNGILDGETFLFGKNNNKIMKIIYKEGKRQPSMTYYSLDTKDYIVVRGTTFTYHGKILSEKEANQIIDEKFKHVYIQGKKFRNLRWEYEE